MSWVEEYFRELEEARKSRFPLPFYNISEGEHVLIFHLTTKPEEINTRYGKRVMFVVSKDNKDYLLLVNKSSPLFRGIIAILKNHMGEKIAKLKIIRAGTGKASRYSVTYVQG
jgi:hypothetical protein